MIQNELKHKILKEIVDLAEKNQILVLGWSENNGYIDIEIRLDTATKLEGPVPKPPTDTPTQAQNQTLRKRLLGKRSSAPSKPAEPRAY